MEDIKKYSYSDDQGVTWMKMDEVLAPERDGKTDGLNPGGQGDRHFAFLASPSNKNEVYVGGDTQDHFPNFIGAADYNGRLFRGDANITATGAVGTCLYGYC